LHPGELRKKRIPWLYEEHAKTTGHRTRTENSGKGDDQAIKRPSSQKSGKGKEYGSKMSDKNSSFQRKSRRSKKKKCDTRGIHLYKNTRNMKRGTTGPRAFELWGDGWWSNTTKPQSPSSKGTEQQGHKEGTLDRGNLPVSARSQVKSSRDRGKKW